MPIKTIEPEAVKQWLESQPEGAIVGTAQACGDCPLARFLNSLRAALGLNNYKAAVMSKWWCVGTFSGNHDQWAKDFIEQIDTLHPGEITREQALQILENCL